MKIIKYLIQAIEEGKITKEKALLQLEKVKENLINYEETKKELIRRFGFLNS